MVACDVCGASDLFVYECQHCGGRFCGEHQAVGQHDCTEAPVETNIVVGTESAPEPTAQRSGTTSKRRRFRRAWLPSTRVTLYIVAILLILGVGIGGVALFEPSLAGLLPAELDGLLTGVGNPDSASALNETSVERLVADRVNAFRFDHDVSQLAYDPALAEIARYHSEDMADRNYTGHVGPEGETVADRFERFGYSCSAPGELILFTQYGREIETLNGTVRFDDESELATGVLNLWRQSPSHREALLTTTWEHIGVGVAVSDDDWVFVTLNAC